MQRMIAELSGTVAELEQRHRALDEQIKQLTAIPPASVKEDDEVKRLKRLKLYLKDEIASRQESQFVAQGPSA